ncbi:DUF3501 family protein [Wenzhouxiangella marina]|uniref:Uncharacterized protein n=1 Tax=Wenzhouxiangella marina TaxID=1579979 RepID=A0A0K0XS78_9GAMM|nr:DUF3501 family protein [Wenzhouxiangella marina]AKS40569.1 hypothetical protein WM2015_180 [Wenzhouxiangella marina]MBB6088337.1 hypothetical protein [Wenzhouxiangella marina]
MSKQLTRDDLLSLEQYAEQRDRLRSEIMAHKKLRQVPIGPNLTLYFEDEKTMRYQIQEMLRIERIFEAEGIQEELDTYNALIPDGSNWKATVMIEYPDIEERRKRLAELVGIEDTLNVQVEGFEPVHAICNEDLERSTEDKTSSVHFARFEFTPEMIAAMKSGARILIGVHHDAYPHGPTELEGPVRDCLISDFD